jgi:hypothetical protein
MAARCSRYGVVKSGPRKGQCRKRPVSGAAAMASGRCKGGKGSAYKDCLRGKYSDAELAEYSRLGGYRRRRRSR